MSSTVIDSYGFSVISKMRAFRSDLRVRSGRLSGRGDIVVLFSRTAPPADVQFRGGQMLFMCQLEERNLGSFWCAAARPSGAPPTRPGAYQMAAPRVSHHMENVVA